MNVHIAFAEQVVIDVVGLRVTPIALYVKAMGGNILVSSLPRN